MSVVASESDCRMIDIQMLRKPFIKKWTEKSCDGQVLWHSLRSGKLSGLSVCRELDLKELVGNEG
jgi:hypothetical protein